MACTIERPCGNVSRFIARRPDGVELHECLVAHTLRVGTPRPPASPVSRYSKRLCAAGDRCEGEGFVEHGRIAAYCLPCEPRRDKLTDRAKWPERVSGCAPCVRSQFGPCHVHGGPDASERVQRAYYQKLGRPFPGDSVCGQCARSDSGVCAIHAAPRRCRGCTVSERNGHGPCERHGGTANRDRKRRSDVAFKATLRRRPVTKFGMRRRAVMVAAHV